jgi:hypothetical protein
VDVSQTISIAAGTSAARIQTIVDSAPEGATLRMAAGSFWFDRTVVIDRDDLTITGAGAGDTVITTGRVMGGDPAFRIGHQLFLEGLKDGIAMSSAQSGDREITVANGHSFRAGDALWIEKENDAAFLNQIGDRLWREDNPLRTVLTTVRAVDGNTLTLDRALPFDFASKGTSVHELDLATGIELRDFTIKGSFGRSDPAKFSNTEPEARKGMALLVNTSKDTVLSGIDIVEPGSHGVVLAKSIDAEVKGVNVTGAHNKGDGGNGYAFTIRDIYDSELTNLTAFDTRHAVLFDANTSSSRNTVHLGDTNRDINFHGGRDHDNEVIVDRSVRTDAEQRYMGGVSFINPGTSYGAPTDPDANTILFREVVGTVRGDLVKAAGGGAQIDTLSGNDTIIGGSGSDTVLTGTGNDLVVGSRGSDTVSGDYGTDTVDFNVWRSDVTFSVSKGQLQVRGDFGVTRMDGVEYLELNNGRYKVSDLIEEVTAKAARADKAGALAKVSDDGASRISLDPQKKAVAVIDDPPQPDDGFSALTDAAPPVFMDAFDLL